MLSPNNGTNNANNQASQYPHPIWEYQSHRYGYLLTLNTWVHVASTFDGTTLRLYINGNAGFQYSRIGKHHHRTNLCGSVAAMALSQYFAGLIDEVRIYNRR